MNIVRISLALLFFGMSLHAAETPLAEFRPDLDALAQPLVDRQIAVGLSIGVIRNGQTLTAHYGETQRGNSQAPVDGTVYEIGSISKTFTCILLADAAERGELGISDTLSMHLPDTVTVPVHGDLKITLRHLATHTSGLPRMPDNFAPADPANPYADYSFDRMYTFLSGAKLSRRPGESFEYSNLGVGLLGHVLEHRYSKNYESLLRERLCDELGMGDTRVALTDAMRARLAHGHDADGEPAANWDIVTLAGAGGIRSTVPDMLKYLAANLVCADTPLGRAMARSHEKQAPINERLSIALGWHIAGDQETRWHNGQTGGYHSWASIHRPTGTAVIVLSNSATGWVDALGERIHQRLLGSTQPLELPPAPVRVSPEQLDALVGNYPLFPAFTITITREDNRLYSQATGQPRFRVFPESSTKFTYHVVDAKLTFELGDDGKARRMTLHQNGRDMPGERQPLTP